MLKLLHEVLYVLIEIVESPNRSSSISLDFVEANSDAVAGHQSTVVDKIKPYINAFIFQTFDPPIEGVQRLGTEMPGILAAIIDEDIGPAPKGFILVNAH